MPQLEVLFQLTSGVARAFPGAHVHLKNHLEEENEEEWEEIIEKLGNVPF